MTEIAPGWEFEVDWESDWLLVKPKNPDSAASDAPFLAEAIWGLLQQHRASRLLLELDQIGLLHSYLVGQLVLLHKRLCINGGAVRLCGLAPHNQEVLHLSRLDDRFPPYANRQEAVQGRRSSQQPE